MKAAEVFPSIAELSDISHSARMVLKHIQKQIQSVYVDGDKNVVSSCNTIVEMKGSVSVQHLMIEMHSIQFLLSFLLEM